MQQTQVCTRCVLPASFPNIRFDGDGVCSQCLQGEATHQPRFQQRQIAEFQSTIEAHRGNVPYDAIACYSGGKDSTYMLRQMVHEYELQVLAFTLDNGFITEQSKQNIGRVVDLLGVGFAYQEYADVLRAAWELNSALDADETFVDFGHRIAVRHVGAASRARARVRSHAHARAC